MTFGAQLEMYNKNGELAPDRFCALIVEFEERVVALRRHQLAFVHCKTKEAKSGRGKIIFSMLGGVFGAHPFISNDMKERSITGVGKVKNGSLMISNLKEFQSFLNKWPGHSFTWELKLSEPGTSQALIGFYSKSVLPQFQLAFKEIGERLTIKQTEDKILQYTTVMSEGNGLYISPEKAGTHRLVEWITELKEFGAMEFGITIEDPRTI